MAKCIYCNSELEIDDNYDIQPETNQYRYKVYGHCPKCKIEYQWEEIFVYQGFEQLEEVDN